MIKCSIIIVNYNTGDVLSRVVSQIINSQNVKEVIVIDNGSEDNSMDLLSEHKKLQSHLRKTNHGFASSCNYGANFANTENLLFLNPDCFINEDALSRLLNELSSSKNAGIIGCMIKNPDGTEQRASRRRLPTLMRAMKTFTGLEKLAQYCACFAGVNLSHQTLKNHTHEVEAISGALILIKTPVFNQIGQFDQDFPLHFEDLDLFKKCQNNGYSILFNPSVEAIHYQGLSSQSNSKVSQLKKIGMNRYFYKHGSYFSYVIIKMVNKIL